VYTINATAALLIFCFLPLWLSCGAWLVGSAPRLVRYGWGVAGGVAVAVGLFWTYGLLDALWMPALTAAVGLGWMALMHGAEVLRDAARDRRARRKAAQVDGTIQEAGD